ncbi:DUF3152 domain-containing protein [Corynebacterium sp. 11A]|uniref:DUF3152 domain-containing protein n=1 Tax=Corynebacterium sp. 11A TaxID=2080510 RepID=UPI00124E3A23|nr:DUF3152 domain-containing protein [Corynebacterium sp. 11A]
MRFARDYGWRAYAIPVLAIITVWVLVDIIHQPAATTPPTASSVPPAATSTGRDEGRPPVPNPADLTFLTEGGQLPEGGPYTEDGRGTYRTVGAPGAEAGAGRPRTFTYVIEVEEGLNPAHYGGDDGFAAMVDATLTNPKGWTADPEFGFKHIDNPDKADLRIQLSSVNTTHKSCGANLGMETSCFTSDGNRVVLNESRWVRGARPFAGDLGAYRQYLINHEVGHGIGYAQHVPCGRDGALAPIMMQQTLSLSNSELNKIDPNEIYPDDNATCSYNAWPYPNGKKE